MKRNAAVKVLFMGKPLREIYPHATRFQVLKYKARLLGRAVVRLSVMCAVIVSAGAIGALYFSSSTVTAQTTTIVQHAGAPVLDRIAKCESGGQQFLPSGAVVARTNTNGSVDVGKYQINLSAAHVREMARLGFNPLTEEGNTAYAQYLYENRGTTDWASSQKCWQ